jgi:AmiR/NasT family two-component response regulator
MSALGLPQSTGGPPRPAEGRSGSIPAILWGRNEDTRLLLRGLLRLNRYPILREVASLDELRALPAASDPRLLVMDAEAEQGDWNEEVAAALREQPQLRVVVILPRDSSDSEERARAAGARATVVRPFAIRDLVAALDRATRDDAPPPPPPPRAEPPSLRQR